MIIDISLGDHSLGVFLEDLLEYLCRLDGDVNFALILDELLDLVIETTVVAV